MPVGAHPRLVVEDAAEVVAVGEDLVLVRQVGAARVDEVDAGQAVLGGDLLRPQVLLDRHRIVGAALHRGVVGDDHHLLPGDPADAGDHARRRARRRRRSRAPRWRRSRGTGCRGRAARPPARAAASCRARRAASPPPAPPPAAAAATAASISASAARCAARLARNASDPGAAAESQHRHRQRPASPSSVADVAELAVEEEADRSSGSAPAARGTRRSSSARLSAVWMMSDTISSSSAARM